MSVIQEYTNYDLVAPLTPEQGKPKIKLWFPCARCVSYSAYSIWSGEVVL